MFYAVVDRETRKVIASEKVLPAKGAYNSELFEIIETEIDLFETILPKQSAAVRKKTTEKIVNRWANQTVVSLKILEPELFYVAMVANIAFRLLEWSNLGKPQTGLDSNRFMVTYAETQAFAETSLPGLTVGGMLAIQESKWMEMQQGFAGIVYKRRKALEQIKLAPNDENLDATLEQIVADLESATLESIITEVSTVLANLQEA